MAAIEARTSGEMHVRGVFQVGDKYICHPMNRINSKGIWFGDDPLTFSFPLLLLQLSLISIITRSIHSLLKPFGQPLIVSQILGGAVLGPSILGYNSAFAEKLFPLKGRAVLDTIAVFGFMLFIFLIGVKIDPRMVLRSGKKSLAIGFFASFVPYVFAGLIAFVLNQFLSLDQPISNLLPSIIVVQSLTSYPVIACFLAELKILNSDIGRLVSSASIICDVCQWSIISLSIGAKVAKEKSLKLILGSFFSTALLTALIVFGVRPAAMWAIRHTPEGKPVKEIYVFAVLVALLCCAFMGEAIGASAMFGSFVMGLVIPDGPPLGATLVDRLDCFISDLLMPIFFTICGLEMDVFAIQMFKNVIVIQLIGFLAFIGKIFGTILPPLFFRMPFRDALSLSLIMNSKGIVEIAMLIEWKKEDVVNEEVYTILVIFIVVVTGVISPLVKALYDPSRRFIAYKRRTILHSKKDEELKILACINTQDNVQTMVNLLDISYPTKTSPINLVVLHLVKLEGRASSLLIAHHPCEKPSVEPTQTERIFNMFRNFEQKYANLVTLQCFKGISPYATMHNDVCSLALEKRTCLIIVPFHKEWIYGGRIESSYAIRHLNKNVLDKAPCTVGILIDRANKQRPRRSAFIEPTVHQVAVLFFGGADDREALAYAKRITEHQNNVTLMLIRFSSSCEIVAGSTRSRMLDNDILGDYRHKFMRSERIAYQEETVTDSLGILSVIRSMENAYELVLVGRRHGDSKLLSNLSKWNENGELGTIGEIFASSAYKGKSSILVMQQQTRVWGLHDPEESTHLRKVDL